MSYDAQFKSLLLLNEFRFPDRGLREMDSFMEKVAPTRLGYTGLFEASCIFGSQVIQSVMLDLGLSGSAILCDAMDFGLRYGILPFSDRQH